MRSIDRDMPNAKRAGGMHFGLDDAPLAVGNIHHLLYAGIVCRKQPISLGMPLVPLDVPRLDFFEEGGLGSAAAHEALTTQMAECNLRHIEPTAMFGGRMDRSCIGYSLRLMGIKGFRKRGLEMGIEISHDQTDFLHVRRMLINKFLEKMIPVYFGPLRRDLDRALPR